MLAKERVCKEVSDTGARRIGTFPVSLIPAEKMDCGPKYGVLG